MATTAHTPAEAKTAWVKQTVSAAAALLLGVLAAVVGMLPGLIPGRGTRSMFANAAGHFSGAWLPLDEKQLIPILGILLLPAPLAALAWYLGWRRVRPRLATHARWAIGLGLAVAQAAALAQSSAALLGRIAANESAAEIHERTVQQTWAGIGLALLAQAVFWLLASRSLTARLSGALVPGFPAGLWIMALATALGAGSGSGGLATLTIFAPSVGIAAGLAVVGRREQWWILQWIVGIGIAIFWGWATLSITFGSTNGALAGSAIVAAAGAILGAVGAVCLGWHRRKKTVALLDNSHRLEAMLDADDGRSAESGTAVDERAADERRRASGRPRSR